MRSRRPHEPGRAALLLAAVFLLLTGSAAYAAPPTDDDCLACHDDPKQSRLKESIHGQAGLACTDCHADLAKVVEFPHAEKLEPPACTSCHEDAGKAWQASVHGEAKAGRPLAQCADCHGGHDVLPAADKASKSNHFNVPATCERCHAQGKYAQAMRSYEDSIHAKALKGSGLVVAPNCSSCHGAHDVLRVANPAAKVHSANVPATCGTCHEGIRQTYEQSVHWARVQEGRRAAVCSDCHSSHGIGLTNVAAWRLDVVRECGTCHEARIRTYRDGFHGKVTKLGYERVATCSDCHGNHDIRPGSDPGSRVNAANRAATCARCHPGATPSFAEYNPHADPEDPESGLILHYTARFMKLLLIGVFSFFGLHTLLWLTRSLRQRAAHTEGK